MTIFNVYIVSKAGGLIYWHTHNSSTAEIAATFTYPLDIILDENDHSIFVRYGERQGIEVGYALVAINGHKLSSKVLPDGRRAMDVLQSEKDYPLSLKFSRMKVSVNERIMMLSTFHSIYAIASQLSPVDHSSGIECLEAGSFSLHCFQTLTGLKFIVVTDHRQGKVEELLHKIYELYADYVLKNPFYSLDMPIKCDLFQSNLKKTLDLADKSSHFSGLTTA